MGDGADSHDGSAALDVGDEETGVALDSHGVDTAADVGGERHAEGIDDEGGDRLHEKLVPKEELEVRRPNPILEDGLPFLDQYGTCVPSFHEGECSDHFAEVFEGGADVAEDDHIGGRDLLMGVDGAHIFHNIVVHMLLRGRKPPHNSRM